MAINPLRDRLHAAIADMQTAYGLQPTPGHPEEVCSDELPQIATAQKAAQGVKRTFQQAPVRLAPQHPLLMLCVYIYNYVKDKILNFLNRDANRILQKTSFLANAAKNYHYINQAQFTAFKAALNDGPKALQGALEDIAESLMKNQRVDRRLYLRLHLLAREHNAYEFMRIVFGLSSVSSIQQFSNELKEVVQPREQLDILEFLQQAYDTSSFTEEQLDTLAILNARLAICRWVHQDEIVCQEQKQLLESLQTSDAAKFTQAVRAYLTSKTYKASGMERDYLLELLSSLDHLNMSNPFVHCAQAIDSFAVLHDWEEKVRGLKELLQEVVETREPLDEPTVQQLLVSLKGLYSIFGKIMENERDRAASPLALGVEQGMLSTQWKEIGRLLEGIASNEQSHHGHNLCGCMFDPDIQEQLAWPDVENTEIRPKNPLYRPDRSSFEGKEKIKILGFYCNRGAGYRSALSAVANLLGPEFHISTIDVPQTTVLPLDPVHQLAGSPHSVTTMYNTMVAGGYRNWFEKIQSLGGGKQYESGDSAVRSLIRAQVLKQQPDIIIIDYDLHAVETLEVAQELGIPFLFLNTDIEVEKSPLNKHPHSIPHFKVAIPYEIPEVVESLSSFFTKDQIVVTGYPVRPAFLKMREALDKGPETIATLRAKYGIKNDEVVYLVSNGGLGLESPAPKALLTSLQGAVPKGHVFVITGSNETYKNALEQYVKNCREKNPDITMHVEGFIDEDRMSELHALAASRSPDTDRSGLFFGKAGGASVAEALTMKTPMLIDMVGGDKELTLEATTARVVKEHGLAEIVYSMKELEAKIKDITGRKIDNYSVFQKNNPESKLYTVIRRMVDEARKDPIFQAKRTVWKTNSVFMRGFRESIQPLTYVQSLGFLRDSVKNLIQTQPFTWDDPDNTVATMLEHKKPCVIDFKSMRLVPAKKYDARDARLVVRTCIHDLEYALKNPSAERDAGLIKIAELYLALVSDQHRSALCKGLTGCKNDPFMMEIAYLDRLIVAMQQPRVHEALALDPKAAYQTIKSSYTTEVARQQLSLWVHEKTARGRDKGLDEPLLSTQDALVSFALHPDQYNWLRELRIHRSASAFNDRLRTNEHGEILVRKDGKEVPVSQLITDSFASVGGRIITNDGQEYTYAQEKGLTAVAQDRSPDFWRGALPVFKKKDRKTKDYRLEIVSDTGFDQESGSQKHCWIRLKSPDGSMYSAGRFWDPDVEFPTLERTQRLPGHIRSGDLHEFMPRTKGKNITITKVDLENQENFLKAKQYIENTQNRGTGFNLVNENCVSFVKEVCQQVGILVASRTTIAEYLLPIGLKARKWLLLHSWAGTLSAYISYPLTILSNVIMGIFGAFKKHVLAPQQNKKLFHSVGAFLDPRGTIDSPYQIRVWQEHINDLHGKKIIPLREMRRG